MKRLGYRKSRNGCLRWVGIGAEATDKRALINNYVATTDPFPYFSRFLTDLNKTETASGWISDLELMHHYTSVSYQTFSNSSVGQKTLQYDVPREALSYSFLLHQILAFSAYHLAYLQPECRHVYLMQAAQHQNDAINGMRGTLLGTITPTNCNALFASSIFLTLSAFATYPSYEKHNPSFSPIDSILDIFTLTDGMSVILRTSDEDLRKGPLREIFIRGAGDATPTTVEATLQPLFDRLPGLSTQLTEIGALEHEGKYIIVNAIIALSKCIAKVSTVNAMSAPVEFRAVFLWPIMMSTDYLDSLRQRQPAALVVLAHYCVIVHLADAFSGWDALGRADNVAHGDDWSWWPKGAAGQHGSCNAYCSLTLTAACG
ncbi:fungal Zn binuclear cluster domain-containing protein [Colletotrichum zoysiae]|uniref:Fungal Zn binuclear cluster domain-containing protein n=1 Tax=Colletotrichum zoysiae TaxID=1216348 RepID=A0AAD9HIR0_9PEZI|nr:fungal Zn binuclear cluster domain-containing protein [Colletotrichum zoysiae]